MARPVEHGWGVGGGLRLPPGGIGTYSAPSTARSSILRRRRQNRRKGLGVLLLWWIPLELALVGLVTWGIDTGVRILADPETFPITNLRVVGDLHHVDQTTLERVTSPSANGGFLQVDIREVRQAALSLPWVDDAHVRRIWPDTLRILITEQVPVARWRSGGLVNARGEIFSPDPTSYPEVLPELGGPQGHSADMLEHFQRLNKAFLPLKLTLTTLQIDDRRAWSFTLNNGIQVLLGKNDLENRLARLLRIYPRALASQADRIGRVDLRYSNGFAVGWKSFPPQDKSHVQKI